MKPDKALTVRLNKEFVGYLEHLEISYTQLRKIILKQAEMLPKIVKKKLDLELNQPISKKISEFVEANCQKTIEKFGK